MDFEEESGISELPDVDIGLFIELVEGYPCLYDLRHKYYKDRDKKEESWRQICSLLGLTIENVEQCKKMWRNLRDTYVRKKKGAPSGSAGGYSKPWPYMKAMEFYENFRCSRKTICNFKKTPEKGKVRKTSSEKSSIWDPMSQIITDSESQTQHSQQSDDHNTEVFDDIENIDPTPATSQKTEQPNKLKKREVQKTDESLEEDLYKRKKPKKDDTGISELVKAAQHISSNIITPSPLPCSNKNSTFGRYIALCLDDMPEEAAEKMRANIVQMIEAKKGETWSP